MDSWGEVRETETNAKWFGGIRGLIGWRNQKQKVRRTHALAASASHWPVFKTLEVEFSVNLPTCAKKMCRWLHKILISNVLAKLYPTLVRCRRRKWTYWAPSFRGISGDEVCSSRHLPRFKREKTLVEDHPTSCNAESVAYQVIRQVRK